MAAGDSRPDTLAEAGRSAPAPTTPTSRSPVQIQSSMSTARTGSGTGLVGYWRFNEGSGTTVSDRSPNAHNGTLGGISASTWVANDGAPLRSGFKRWPDP